jgi:hypothetical protein
LVRLQARVPRQGFARALAVAIGVSALFLTGVIAGIAVYAMRKAIDERETDRHPRHGHRHVTHNKCYVTCAQFADATLGFLREQVPRNWVHLCDSVTDNFRVILPKNFRVMT